MAANFALRFGVIVDAPEIVAVEHGREGAIEWENFKAVTREIEFTDYFGAKQRDNVGTLGEQEAGNDFFGNGCAAENSAAFENEDLLACFRQIGGIHQTVVAAADDDHIIGLRHSL